MKKYIIILLAIFLAEGCKSVNEIGKINMISTRNVDPNLNYKVITTYSGSNKKELRKSKATTIDEAIDKPVKNVPGGEFLMNVKIYQIDKKYYAAQGDVWGTLTQEGFKGFKIGDKVTWAKKSIIKGKIYITGTITALKDDKTCLVKMDNDTDKTIALQYQEITKTSQISDN